MMRTWLTYNPPPCRITHGLVDGLKGSESPLRGVSQE